MKRNQTQANTFHNLDAERAILGRVILDETVWWEIADRLTPADFANGPHSATFTAMVELAKLGRQISHASLVGQIVKIDFDGDSITISTWLSGLIALAQDPTVKSVSTIDYIDLIQHQSTRRHLINVADSIRQAAETATLAKPGADLRQQAIKLIAANDNGVNEADTLGNIAARVLLRANDASTKGTIIGVRSGLAPFDELVGPMLPGNLIVVGGETSSGKTALATEVAVLIASNGVPVDISSLEMTEDEIGARAVAGLAELTASRIIEGEVGTAELDRMATITERILEWPLWINAKPRQTMGMIEARLARAVARHGIRLAVIDHLQYVRPDDGHRKEHEQVKQVVDDAKAMAKRLGIPVILVSHVSRDDDRKPPTTVAGYFRRPRLRDLYGSSAIEKAADTVLFVHRPSWFLERSSPPGPKLKSEWEAERLRWKGMAELVLAKRRNGKGYGVRELEFDEERTWFRGKKEAA